MKKIILVILLIGICFIAAGCEDKITDLSVVETNKYAMIIMPDGKIITGKCTNFLRYSNGWVYVAIDNTKYYANEWRIVTWENK